MKRDKSASEARQRILETADRLFNADGVRAVGIDRIIAESGVAKMTLYSHFRSKDDLILAVLQYHEVEFNVWFGQVMARHVETGLDQLNAFFEALKEWFETPTFRGCCFINASVELADPAHPGFVFVREQKERFHAFLTRMIEDSLGLEAKKMAPSVCVLVEGAIVCAVIQGASSPADVARDAAIRLVSASTRA